MADALKEALVTFDGLGRWSFDDQRKCMVQNWSGEFVRHEEARAVLNAGEGPVPKDHLRAEIERLKSVLKWTDEVYPARIEAGGAGIEITWDEYNAMREAVGFRPVKRINDEEGRAGFNHKLRARVKALEAANRALQSSWHKLDDECNRWADKAHIAESMLADAIATIGRLSREKGEAHGK